jgi:hypothetical protein
MNRILLSIATAFLFCAAAALAQNSSSQTDSQGSQNSAPTASQQGSSSGMQGSEHAKGEQKLTGCVRSSNGEYMLETKKGKTVALAGQDVSAHVGHTVAVHGSWSSAGASDSSSMGSGSSAKAGKSFNVSSVDMISDSCSADKSGTSGKQY